MAKEVSGEDGVAPGGIVDADLLEEPPGIGTVTVGHIHGGLDGLGGVKW